MKHAAVVVALLLGTCCFTALAHDTDDEGHAKPHTHWWLELDPSWYVGAGLGQGQFDNFQLVDDGSFTSHSNDDGSTVWRVFGGMGIGKYLALEVGLADFGEASSRAQSDGTSSNWNAGPQRVKVDAEGYDAFLVLRLPLTQDWGVFAKVGQTWWEGTTVVALDAQCCGVVAGTIADDGNQVTYGGGVHYDGLRPVRITAEYGRLPLEDSLFLTDLTLDWIAISAAYLF